MLFPGMASPERRPRRNLHAQIELEVVAPLFADVTPVAPADASVPEIVLRNRRNRARERVLEALVSRGSADVPDDLQKDARRLVRRWAAAGFSDGFKEAEEFEIRCARELELVLALDSGDQELVLEVFEKDYRRRVIEQFGRIELRGIQTAHRVLYDLDQVYVPLHLEPQPEEVDGKDGKVITLPTRTRVPVLEALQEHRRLLIIGTPGSGKSTLTGYLATQAAAGQLAGTAGLEGDALPFVITVRSLGKPSLTPRGIADHVSCRIEVVQRAIQQKRVFLLFDGLDEARPETRETLVDLLLRFAGRQAEARIIVTSRPAGPPGEIETSLPGLRPFHLAPLSIEEINSFIDKWCLAAEVSRGTLGLQGSSRPLRLGLDGSETEKEAAKAAADLKRRLDLSFAVQKLAANPLLATILCVVHRFLGRTIPEHRVTLYEKCTDALLYEWDRAKFPEGAAIGELDAPAKRRLLMAVARTLHERHQTEISEQEVVRHFSEALPDLGRPASDAKAIVAEIRDRSGLLVERRPGAFAFSHLTFQEYLCALDFVRTRSFKDLTTNYRQPWWHEVIVLAAGTPGGSGAEIARHLLERRDLRAKLLAAQCLDTDVEMPLKVREEIEREVRSLIPPETVENALELARLGITAAPLLARALPQANARAATFILLALLDIDFAPAIPVIARCASDTRRTQEVFLGGKWAPSIGAFATFIVAVKARTTDIARYALGTMLRKISIAEVRALAQVFVADEKTSAELREIFTSALKARESEISPPKRARRTA